MVYNVVSLAFTADAQYLYILRGTSQYYNYFMMNENNEKINYLCEVLDHLIVLRRIMKLFAGRLSVNINF